jgi:pyridoxal phosphate enzyme (YggS family)
VEYTFVVFFCKIDYIYNLGILMVAENAKIIRNRMDRACSRAGRSADEITLIAVTKTFDTAHIRMALQAGIANIGENYVQEARNKHEELAQESIRWHFIGHLQSNKIKYIGNWVSLIHAVDTVEIGQALSSWALRNDRHLDVLIEVNTSGEASKFGVAPENALLLVKSIARLQNIHVKGLMTVGPFLPDPESSRPAFASLRSLRDSIRNDGIDLTELSMGMTNDFEVAIEEGATMIRIGTGIFGKRVRKQS